MSFLSLIWHINAYSKPRYFSQESREDRQEIRAMNKMSRTMNRQMNKMRGAE